jgi:hypothetical protein
VSHQVEELKEDKEGNKSKHEFLASGPGGRAVLRMQEEVHIDETKDEPVVEGVLEQIEDGHAVVREAMHIQGLELTLEVVSEHKGETNLLIESERLVCFVDLLAEADKKGADHNWPSVFKKEYCFPRDLRAKVLENEGQRLIGA